MKELDQDVVNRAKAIRQVESGGKIGVSGESREFGQYQFQPDTWNRYSKEVGISTPLEQATPEQQNQVVYTKLKSWKDKGYNPGQIASMWNAGEGKPDAYIQGHKGINEFGVEYDTPTYARKVAETYHQLKGSQVPIQPSVQSTQQEVQKPPQQNIQQEVQPRMEAITPQTFDEDEKKANALEKVINFAFPILEKKERTGLQTLGDVGLSALWFVPGVGAAASTALRGAGLGAKAARSLGAVGTGATVGYGADVAGKLSEGETGTDVLKPGLGTVAGAGTAGLASRIGGRLSQKGVIDKIAKDNTSVFGQTKAGAKSLAESFSKNKNPGLLAAEKGINLKQMIDPETVKYATLDKVDDVVRDASTLNEVLTTALARVPASRPVREIESQLLAKIPKNYPERADVVRREMDLLRRQYGDNPTVADLNEWKQRNWNLGKFDMAVPGDTRLTHRMIGNALKKDVETLSERSGLKGVGEMNEYIGSHYDLADILGRMHGNAAKGGRLGDLLRTRTFEAVGGTTGAMFGGGVPGALAGAVIGNYSARALSSILRKVEAGPIRSAILKRMVKEDPEIVQKMLQASGRTPQELQKIKAQLAAEGIDIFAEQTPRQIAPKLAPREGTGGLIPGLIGVGGGRIGAQ